MLVLIIKWIKKNSEVLTKEDFSLLRLKMITNNNDKNIDNNYKKKVSNFYYNIIPVFDNVCDERG